MAYFGLQLHPDVATGIPPLQVTAPISQVQSLVLGRDRERGIVGVKCSGQENNSRWPGQDFGPEPEPLLRTPL